MISVHRQALYRIGIICSSKQISILSYHNLVGINTFKITVMDCAFKFVGALDTCFLKLFGLLFKSCWVVWKCRIDFALVNWHRTICVCRLFFLINLDTSYQRTSPGTLAIALKNAQSVLWYPKLCIRRMLLFRMAGNNITVGGWLIKNG